MLCSGRLQLVVHNDAVTTTANGGGVVVVSLKCSQTKRTHLPDFHVLWFSCLCWHLFSFTSLPSATLPCRLHCRLHYTPITIALTRTSFGVRIVITAFGLRKSAFSTCSHPPIQSDFSPILLPVVQTSTEASKHPLDSSSARHAGRPPCACGDFCISFLVFGCFWLFFVIFCLQTSLGFAFLRLRFRKLQISSYVMKFFSHIFHIIGCCCCRFSAVRLHC